MLDTMTMTKVVGAFCGALLVYLLGSWVGEALYHSGGHGADQQAYVIETGEGDADAGDGAEEVPFLTLVREGDAGAGERVFRQCAACHKIDAEQNGAGPHLVNLLGRDIGSVAGFNYSGALPAGQWGVDNLNPWLEAPSAFASGTSMSYNGVKKVGDRANLIAYLVSMTEGYTLPEAEAAVVEDAAAPADEDAAVEPEVAGAPSEDAAGEALESAALDVPPADPVPLAETAPETAEAETPPTSEAPADAAETAEVEVPAGAEAATETAEAPAEATTETAEAPAESATETAEAPAESATETAEAPAEAATETAEAPAESATEATEAPVESATETAEAPSETAAAEPPAEAATEPAEAEAVETAEAAPAPAPEPAAAVTPIMAAYEAADVAAGKAVWRQCQACHVADKEQNRVGPHLVGLLGRPIGSIDGFRYSGKLPEGEWTLDELNAWLENPREYAAGTSMSFRGLADIEDRANVIAYIESLN